MAPDEIPEHLPGRNAVGCRRRYQELHASWSEQMKNNAKGSQVPKNKTVDSTSNEGCIDIDVSPVGEAEEWRSLATKPQEQTIPRLSSISDDMALPSTDESGSQTSTDCSDISDPGWPDDLVMYSTSRLCSLESPTVDRLVGAFLRTWPQTSTADAANVAAEPADASGSSPHENTSSESNPSPQSSSKASSSGTGLISRSTSEKGGALRKRQRQDDDEDEGDKSKTPQAQKRQRVDPGKKLLACPFQKRYPLQHFFCGHHGKARGFSTIAYVKDHIRKFHIRSPVYCHRCKHEFDDSDKLDKHIDEFMKPEICEERPFPDETALPWKASLQKWSRTQVKRCLNMDEQWFSVWGFLFPGIVKPLSSRVDDDICEHIRDIQQFVTTQGDDTVCCVANPLIAKCKHILTNICFCRSEKSSKRMGSFPAQRMTLRWSNAHGNQRSWKRSPSVSVACL